MPGAEKLLWCPLKHHFAAFVAAFGTHIDDPVGVFDDIQIVFDDDDRIAGIDQAIDDGEKVANIRHMQACGWLIHDINTAFFVQFAGEFDPLALATGECAERLPQCEIIQTDIAQGLQFANNFLDAKEVERLPTDMPSTSLIDLPLSL